ncbi:MAG: DUF2231 domain-containing protein [Syntrophales bacterium]
MESKVKIVGHPIHPMLIVFPLGLLTTAVIFDILYLALDQAIFPLVSFWLIIAGIVGGLVAALFGLADWLSIPGGTRAKSVGLLHGVGNVVVVALFAVSWFLRLGSTSYKPGSLALIFSFAAAILALVAGWLGGELVFRLGMAVDPGANLDAPSSLSGRPVTAAPAGSRPAARTSIGQRRPT